MLLNNHKVKEEITVDDDGTIHVVNHFDGNQILRQAQYAREVSPNAVGSDWKHVGEITSEMLHIWLKEAGVSWTDPEAIKEVIKRKLMDGEFSQLRNWEGKW
jgi:hypothetical protein